MKPPTSKIRSSAFAGAGGGTLLVVIAKTLPQPWSNWLVLAAPSLSVGVSASFLWAKQYIEEHMEQWEYEGRVKQARETLEAALKNSNTSEEHKAEMRQALEKLEKGLVQRSLKRIDAVSTPVEG
jgi:hypothetical protein